MKAVGFFLAGEWNKPYEDEINHHPLTLLEARQGNLPWL